MRPRQDIIDFAEAEGHAVSRDKECTRVLVSMRQGWIAEVLVPDGIHEWFITITDPSTGQRLFHDWCEHYSIKQEPRSSEELTTEVVDHVEAMMRTLASSECRVRWSKGVTFLDRRWLRVRKLQVRTDAGWADIWESLDV